MTTHDNDRISVHPMRYHVIKFPAYAGFASR